MNTLAAFLRERSNHSFRGLMSELEEISAAHAFKYKSDTWPDHPWGVGQDGSIAGIVYHVAAWKQMTMPLFEPGGAPQTRSQFDPSSAPVRGDWPATMEWLKQAGEEWLTRLDALTDSDFDELRDWEGRPTPISSFVVEMMEHDIQHASQIAYIRQRIGAGER